MNLRLRALELEEARGRATLLETGLRETLESLGQSLPAGAVGAFLARSAGRPETLILIAEREDRELGILITAPFEEPATGESAPLIVALHVAEEFRHRGLARALFGEARRLLALRGLRRILARAGHNDDVLISMGERWGLVRTWELMA